MLDCKDLVKSDCLENNNCSWINGKKLKYCKSKNSLKSQSKLQSKSLDSSDFEGLSGISPKY